MITKSNITYHLAGGAYPKITIPKGVRCDRAYNLPKANGRWQYWARGWRGMSKDARNIKNSIGFLLSIDEINAK